MRVSYNTWLTFPKFQWNNSTDTWPKAFNILHLSLHLKSQQEIQIQSGHWFSYRSLCNSYRIAYTAGLGISCCYFFWYQPARLVHPPLQPGTMQYTIMDDDVEAASIYRCDGRASQLTRPHENHGLHIEHIPTLTESQCKQQTQSLVVPAQGSLVNTSKIQETQKCT